MTKSLGTGQSAKFDDDVLFPTFLMDFIFDSPNELYLWTGFGDMIYNSRTYYGVGNVIQISDIVESAEIAAKGVTLTLDGVSTDITAIALQEPYQGRICTIRMALMDGPDEHPANGTATEVFSGYMDTMAISENGNTATVEMTLENKLVDLERPRVSRFTHAYQQSVYPDDMGLVFVNEMQDKVTLWGKTAE